MVDDYGQRASGQILHYVKLHMKARGNWLGFPKCQISVHVKGEEPCSGAVFNSQHRVCNDSSFVASHCLYLMVYLTNNK